LKGTVKGVNTDGGNSSVVPTLDEVEAGDEDESIWPPPDSVLEDEDED
jgi:hypothetical protein